MPQVGLMRAVWLLCLPCIIAADGATQRAPSPALRAVDAAIAYRLAWLGDSTRFDACSVYDVTGRPRGFPAGLTSSTRLLGRASEACPHGRVSPSAQQAPRVVIVDTVVVSDETARVSLTVRRGEYTHRERFEMRMRAASGTWGVDRVTLWGAVQSSAPRVHRRD